MCNNCKNCKDMAKKVKLPKVTGKPQVQTLDDGEDRPKTKPPVE